MDQEVLVEVLDLDAQVEMAWARPMDGDELRLVLGYLAALGCQVQSRDWGWLVLAPRNQIRVRVRTQAGNGFGSHLKG